jgi:hypothetical protein
MNPQQPLQAAEGAVEMDDDRQVVIDDTVRLMALRAVLKVLATSPSDGIAQQCSAELVALLRARASWHDIRSATGWSEDKTFVMLLRAVGIGPDLQS